MIELRGLTLVGVAVGNLEDARTVQLMLPFDRRSSEALDAALDEVRARFGATAITGLCCWAATGDCRYRCSRLR
jgi:DNA polymerase-4